MHQYSQHNRRIRKHVFKQEMSAGHHGMVGFIMSCKINKILKQYSIFKQILNNTQWQYRVFFQKYDNRNQYCQMTQNMKKK